MPDMDIQRRDKVHLSFIGNKTDSHISKRVYLHWVIFDKRFNIINRLKSLTRKRKLVMYMKICYFFKYNYSI